MIKKLFSINQVKKAACDAINNGAIYNEPCLFSISGIIKPSEKNIYYLVNPNDSEEYLSLGFKVPEEYQNGSDVPVEVVVTPKISLTKDYKKAFIYFSYVTDVKAGEIVRSSFLQELGKSLKDNDTIPFYTNRIPKFKKAPQKICIIASKSEKSSIFSDIMRGVFDEYRSLVNQKKISVSNADDVVNALNELNDEDTVVLLARGGGSEEDFDTFNNVAVLNAIARSKAYIITALGHSGDITMADLMADARQRTPSAAGEFLDRILRDNDQFK